MVNTKMKAIADKIRALLGLSEGMGLNQMASSLDTVQTELENAYTAIGNQKGTVPEQKIMQNLTSAIGTVNTGVTVLRKSGTVSAGSSGKSVDCGFKPDLVFLHNNGSWYDDDDRQTYYNSAAFAFKEESRTTNAMNTAMWTESSSIIAYDLYCEPTTNGFKLYSYAMDASGNIAGQSATYNYVAVKYS